MTAPALKPAHPLTSLHLGCGESLSQLLPPEPQPAVKPVPPAPSKTRAKPRRGGGK